MSKKLAIQGHSTRGKEVIELLEMMGGENTLIISGNKLSGYEQFNLYYINDNGVINYKHHSLNKNMILFTLEEFLEKYPFKVRDKVFDIADWNPGNITAMKWDEDVSDMKYYVAFDNGDMGWYTNDTIGFLKCERTHEDVIFDSIIWHLRNSVNNGKQNLSGGECEDYFREVVKKNNENKMKNVLAELLEHIKNTSKEELEKEFNELEEWSNVGPTVEEFMTFCECVNKKPKYPKTLGDCCKAIGDIGDYQMCGYKHELLFDFQNLLICRNAYWKIAGEEMRLDKPWEPKFGKCVLFDITFYFYQDNFVLHKAEYSSSDNCILVFPTEEMRDAFYENFKDLIEQCKELL